jgi:hypothetical protein
MKSITKRIPLALCAGAALLLLPGVTLAAAVPDKFTQRCADKLQLETLKYVNQVQKQIRLSIKNNLKGKSSKCAHKFYACAGGSNNGGKCDPTKAFCSVTTAQTCVLDADCPLGETCDAAGNTDCPAGGQCHPDTRKGIAGKINKAKGKLRDKFAQFCTDADLITLFGVSGNSRCPDPSDPDDGLTASELADCVLVGAIGDTNTAIFGDAAGEIMGRAANSVVPDDPLGVCAVTLASGLSIGSASADVTLAEAGGVAPSNVDGCVGTLCDTSGAGIIGNNLTAPTQTFAGVIAICLVTVTGDAGNGTPADGQIDIATGEQTSFAPISSTVLIGTTCPVCTAGVCDSGDNAGQPCTSPNGTDTACPPTVVGVPPVIPNPLDLTSEGASITVPANSPGTGVTNPSGTFCGACDFDETVGCNHDSVCVAAGACSGAVGSGCCVFGTNTGAFGDASATTASAPGVRGPYVARLGTVFCTGKSGSGLVDGTQGLPGPVRLVQQQLNAFTY